MSTISSVNFSFDLSIKDEIVKHPDDFVFRCQEDKIKNKNNITIEAKGKGIWGVLHWFQRNIFCRSQYKLDAIIGKIETVVQKNLLQAPAIAKFRDFFNESLEVAYLFTKKVEEYQFENEGIQLSKDLRDAVVFVGMKLFREIQAQVERKPPQFAPVDKGKKPLKTPPKASLKPLGVGPAPAAGKQITTTQTPATPTGQKEADLGAAKKPQTLKRSLSTGSASAMTTQTIATPTTGTAPAAVSKDKTAPKAADLAARASSATPSLVGAAPQQKKKVARPFRVGAEIHNQGNTCFLDSTLQALRTCTEFRQFIFDNAPVAPVTEEDFQKAKDEIKKCEDQITKINSYVPPEYEKQYNKHQESLLMIRDEREAKILELQEAEEAARDIEAAIQDLQKLLNNTSRKMHLITKPHKNKSPHLTKPQKKKLASLALRRQKLEEDIRKKQAQMPAKIKQNRKDIQAESALKIHNTETAWAPTQKIINDAQKKYKKDHALDIAALREQQKKAHFVMEQSVAYQIKNFFNTVEKEPPEIFQDVYNIRTAIKRATWGEYTQEDAREAFGQILEYLHVPQFSFITKTVETLTGANEVLKESKTPGNAILLPLHGRTLDELLHNQKLDEEVQGKPVPAIQTISLDPTHAPKMLPIWLNRFNAAGGKIHSRVTIPPEVEISKCHYRLKSCVIHQGESCHGGHYITYCPREEKGKVVWYEFDDRSQDVAKKEFKDIEADLSQDCYGLFYELIEEAPKKQNPPAQPNQGANAK